MAKQNADRSGFRQTHRRLLGLSLSGVATRPRLACSERTPTVPVCQYPFKGFLEYCSAAGQGYY
jgi:hypothetical protein